MTDALGGTEAMMKVADGGVQAEVRQEQTEAFYEVAGHGSKKPRRGAEKRSLLDPQIVRRASIDALKKLNPTSMAKNPVMFVVEVGSVVTTVLLFKGGAQFGFNLQITLWLWFTVLFANFAEAMAEGRGKAQADALRKAKSETIAHVIRGEKIEEIPSSKLRVDEDRK